jgi:hypothetical protein
MMQRESKINGKFRVQQEMTTPIKEQIAFAGFRPRSFTESKEGLKVLNLRLQLSKDVPPLNIVSSSASESSKRKDSWNSDITSRASEKSRMRK